MSEAMKSGTEPFVYDGIQQGNVLHFWQWSSSDLLSNALRGRLAEYIIATALRITEQPRLEWAPFDLEYREIKIEVKSSAYVQSWFQKELSQISFGIQPTRAWDSTTNTSDTECKRQSHLYIFALLQEQDKELVNPLNLNQWKFYILKTGVLNEVCGSAKRISLGSLKKLNPFETDFSGIKNHLDQMIA